MSNILKPHDVFVVFINVDIVFDLINGVAKVDPSRLEPPTEAMQLLAVLKDIAVDIVLQLGWTADAKLSKGMKYNILIHHCMTKLFDERLERSTGADEQLRHNITHC